jgi:hypothetical protein
MAAIDDLINKIDGLITVLQNNNSNSTKPNGLGVIGNDPSESTFQNFTQQLEGLVDQIKRLETRHTDYTNSQQKGGVDNKEWEKDLNNFINGLKLFNNSSSRGTEKFNTTKKYFRELTKTLDEQVDIQKNMAIKRFNLMGLEYKLETENLKLKNLELDERKQTIKDEIAVSKSRTKANKEIFDDLVKTRKETLKYQQDIGVQRKQAIQKLTSRIKEKGEARAEKWSTNKNGYERWYAPVAKALSNKITHYETAKAQGRLGATITADVTKGISKTTKFVQSGKMDVSGMADGASNALMASGNPYAMAAGAVVQVLKSVFEMFAGVDKAASDYARSVGGGHYAQVKMRESAASLAAEMSKLGSTVYEAEELLTRMAEASEKMGRNLEYLSTDSLRSLVDLKKMGIDDETISQFDTFGVSVHNASKQLTDLYGESGKKGLNAKATIKAFTSNLKMAQNYTFARGQKALMDMAMKSAQLKFNLRDAEQFANKVSTLEGAMTAGAQLSVLGGNFAMQGNPLAMMYNGLNDVEGLQEQMLAMTKGMARWDSKKGQLDITAFDRERLKAMSQATGIDYSELTSQAFNQARVDRVSAQLGGGFSKQEEEYIKNIAELDENGRAQVSIEGQTYTMDQLRSNSDLRNRLKAESEKKDVENGSDMGKVISTTRSIQDVLDDYVKYFRGQFTKLIMKIGGLNDAERAAMDLGIDPNDTEATKALKKELNKRNWTRIGAGITTGAATGAAVGAVATPIGSLTGALGGAAIGGISGLIGNAYVDDSEYLKQWAKENGLVTQQKATGGFVSGKGGPTEDAIPARLSNGEFVVNAEATTRFRPLLERINSGVKNGANLMKHTPVGEFAGRMLDKAMGNQKIEVSPIKIEFGTLELKIGDLSRVLDSNEVASRLLNNSAFVDNIVKEIGIRANFGYRKDDSSNKFLDSPFVRSF